MAKDAVIVTVAAASVEAVVDVAAAEAGPGTAGGRGAGNFFILLLASVLYSQKLSLRSPGRSLPWPSLALVVTHYFVFSIHGFASTLGRL